MNNEIHTSPLSTLDTIKLAEDHLIEFGYAKSTMDQYLRTWKQLSQFVYQNPIYEPLAPNGPYETWYAGMSISPRRTAHRA